MMVHVAVLKTIKKFNEMTMDDKIKNYHKAVKFFNEYIGEAEVENSDNILNPHQQYFKWFLTYTNAKGEQKNIQITAYEDVNYNKCSIGLQWY